MSKPIGPILRALHVLEVMNRQPQASLQRLHEATGLPKSTLHRLLATLKSAGYVRSDVAQGIYSLTSKVRELSEGYTEYEGIVEVSGPILLRYTRESGMPLAIGTLERDRIVVRYSSMPYSPLGSEHSTIGNSHDLLHSGMGQAYLAYCADSQREALVHLLSSQIPPAEAAALEQEVQALVLDTRRRGYGYRGAAQRGRSATIAIPLMANQGVLGVLSLSTFHALLKTTRARTDSLRLLERVRSDILDAFLDTERSTDDAHQRTAAKVQ